MDLSNDDVTLIARALSIHRVALRRKLDRVATNTHEQTTTIDEIRRTSRLIETFMDEDLRRSGAA